MTQPPRLDSPERAPRSGTLQDRAIVYSHIPWQQFKLIQAGFNNAPGIKLAYYDNTIEILMPGREHEFFSRFIGFLIGMFCWEKGIEFEPMGSMTQEKEGIVSLQADESYCFGTSKPIPDLAIEIIFSSGNANKLQKYRALEVPEVWFWQDGLLRLYHLYDTDYRKIARSQLPELSTLDIELLTRCVLMAQTSRLEAIQAFRNGCV
ncbi:Uma2 family endonuclease [Oscillatoria sp. FACHB-1406]|uniref:Uma2 family endonuclease n=1 Tax=Oscillatoria sp. FACHB-1406 TaxID=2692846 RepID=UPI0016870EB1|nr:Uma2 family endonuclease [Oscillatoria sp. FACHB-1406]MBD2579377.1 Uma2 family endonuclease [Oscillatoria sp. FACHB-1406]